jgi:2,3-bisphosphoglycerate-independent phosphoglycerate mutase
MGTLDDRWNVRSAMIVEVGLLRGLAKLLNSEIIDVPGATGGVDTDTSAIGAAIVEAFNDHDFILCNVKGPDVCGHDGEPKQKVEIIERIDVMVGEILDRIGDDVLIVVTADHSTPVSVKDHSGDPTPIMFWGPGVRTDDVMHYDERAVVRGGIGRIRGTDVMPMITNLMGVQEKFGA